MNLNRLFLPVASPFPASRLTSLLIAAIAIQAVAPPALARTPNAAPVSAAIRAAAPKPNPRRTLAETATATNLALVPLGITANGVASVAFDQGSGGLVTSAHAPTGLPANLERIAASGAISAVSGVTGIAGELPVATPRVDRDRLSLGRFGIGGIYFGTNVAGTIGRVTGSGAATAGWVVLPNEPGLVRGLAFDATGSFGGDLLAVTTFGNVWRVASSGTARLVAATGRPLSSVAVLPENPTKYGPWSGRLLALSGTDGTVVAIDSHGASAATPIGVGPGDLSVVAADENFYGVDAGLGHLVAASATQFSGMAGDLLIAERTPGNLWRVWWDGSNIQKEQIASVSSWSGATFAPVGITTAIRDVPRLASLERYAPLVNGRIDGSVQQNTGSGVSINTGAAINGDLLVPGTPNVVLNGTPAYGGTIQGAGSSTPTGYNVTLNSGGTLGHAVTRTNAVTLPVISPPPASTGTRSVSINAPGQSIGDPATLRDLTLNSNVGPVAVPPGTYRNFVANAGSAFVFGVSGSAEPTTYNLNQLTLNSSSRLDLVGPIRLLLGNGITLNASAGSGANALWLALDVASGSVTLNSNSSLYG
ncbi:MAG TPA: hypothetical protein PLF26_20410, partial [Blastocatellia bacterium]|nr:hypothetical protein [Blastocatellia bacterium]